MLEECVSVLGALECVVRRCLGPDGGSVLLTRDTGETLITRHGQRVLCALQLEHPVARMVLDCMCAHAKATGDGTKSFILLLAALLRGIQNSAHMHRKGSWTGPGLQNLANRLLAVSRKELDDAIIHKITPYVSLYCSHHSYKLEGCILDLLIGGYISGRVAIGQADILKRVLCEFYHKVCQDQDIIETISFIHSHFSLLHTPVTGLPVGASEVIEGLVVTRDWSVWTELQGPVKALILYESFGPSFVDNISVSIQQDWLHRTESIMKQKLLILLDLQVHVLLSSVKQPESVVQWARLNHIALLEFVDSAQLDFLSNISAAETLSHPPLQHLVKLKYCRSVLLGGHRYACLGTFSHTHTLVLCAPAPGLLDQTVCVSQGVFAMLQHLSRIHDSFNKQFQSSVLAADQSKSPSLDQSQSTLSTQDLWGGIMRAGGVLPVGGMFEFLLHDFLLNERNCGDPECCRLLAEALLCVPRALYSHNQRCFLNIQTSFLSDLKQSDRAKLQGSELPDLKFGLGFSEPPCLESVSGKQQLVVSVLQCLHRLLSVGAILHTRSPLRTGAQTHSDDDEEEEEATLSSQKPLKEQLHKPY
ncbi:Bardet-Biedl syndrome 10 protein [Pseudorasbora parva]|uniref:Bardet-Biedl syndrome 10 protein n=1 Tax=Pseudorasbora parva TaxID=51549 RepID=UPI00351E764E